MDNAELTPREVQNIPLPNQLPRGIDFSELPSTATRSSTVESLLQQNEDLMARLAVSLRRNSEYEDKFQELNADYSNLRTRFESLKDQYLVLQEKDRSSMAHVLELATEAHEQTERAEKLERLYTDIFLQAQAFQNRLIRLERNQARFKKAAKTIQLKSKIVPELSTEVFNLQSRLAEARSEIDSIRPKLAERENLFAAKVQIENDLVYEQRLREKQALESSHQIAQLGHENASLRSQLKERLVLTEAQTHEIQELKSELPALKNERDRLAEQVESLQALWNHKQKENEQMDEKLRALQKLNQNISLTMNQQRKQLIEIEARHEQDLFRVDEERKILLAEIDMLRNTKTLDR